MMNAANISLLNLLQPMMGQAAGDAGITPEQMITSLEKSGMDTEFWSLLNQQLTGMIQDGELQLTENKDLIALIEAVEQNVGSGEPVHLDPQLMMQLKSHFKHGEPVKLVINEAGEVELVANVEPAENETDIPTNVSTEDGDRANPAVAAMLSDQTGERLPPKRQAASAEALNGSVQSASNQTEKQALMDQHPKQAVNPEQPVKMTEPVKAEKSLPEEAQISEEKSSKLKFLTESEQDMEAVKQPRQSVVEVSSHQNRPDINTLPPKIMAPVTGMAGNVTMTPQGLPPAASSLPVLTLQQSADSAEWGQAIGERVTLLINQKLNQAEIRIDPPHLGKLDIQVQLSDDKAIVNIQTQQAQTRDLVDNASMRLREFLQEAGYESVDVNVSHQEHSSDQQMKGQEAVAGADLQQQEEEIDDLSIPAGLQHHNLDLQPGRIDYFA